MIKIPDDLYYYVGEKPPPLPCRYEDKDGNLISLYGATLQALVKIDTETAEATVACTNPGTGAFTIDWSTATSNFTKGGQMRVDVKVTHGSGFWYMDRFSIPIKDR